MRPFGSGSGSGSGVGSGASELVNLISDKPKKQPTFDVPAVTVSVSVSVPAAVVALVPEVVQT